MFSNITRIIARHCYATTPADNTGLLVTAMGKISEKDFRRDQKIYP